MSDKPAVTRINGKLHINEAAEALIRTLAAEHGILPDKAVADVRRGLPAARLLLGMVGLAPPVVKNGRPHDNAQYNLIRLITSQLVHEHGQAKGVPLAVKELARRCVTGRKGKPLTTAHVREIYQRPLDPERDWFQAPGEN